MIVGCILVLVLLFALYFAWQTHTHADTKNANSNSVIGRRASTGTYDQPALPILRDVPPISAEAGLVQPTFVHPSMNMFSYQNVYPSSPLELPSISKYQSLKQHVDAYQPQPDGVDQDGNHIEHADEIWMKICCQLAVRAVSNNNFGIGVVIVDPLMKLKPHLANATVMIMGKRIHYLSFVKHMLESLGYTNVDHDPHLSQIVSVGVNQIFNEGWFEHQFVPHARSNAHGEMMSMDILEDAISTVPYEKEYQTKMPQGLRMYSQLESCMMCVGRLASSAISEVRHGASDNGGGIVHKLCALPPIFIGLTSGQIWQPARITGKVDGSVSNSLIHLCNETFNVNVASVGTKQNNRLFGCPQCPNFKYCFPENSPQMVKRMTYDLPGFIRY